MTDEKTHPSDRTQEQLSNALAFLRRTLRFWRTALGVLVLGAAACALFLIVRRPLFRSEAVILYSEGVRLGDEADRPGAAHSAMTRLKEILMSRTSLDAVAKAFDLYPETRKTLISLLATLCVTDSFYVKRYLSPSRRGRASRLGGDLFTRTQGQIPFRGGRRMDGSDSPRRRNRSTRDACCLPPP